MLLQHNPDCTAVRQLQELIAKKISPDSRIKARDTHRYLGFEAVAGRAEEGPVVSLSHIEVGSFHRFQPRLNPGGPGPIGDVLQIHLPYLIPSRRFVSCPTDIVGKAGRSPITQSIDRRTGGLIELKGQIARILPRRGPSDVE